MKSAAGTHSGTGLWLVQRASAVVLALAMPGLALYFLTALPLDFAGWQALFAPPWLRVLMLLTAATLALHAWAGMRDILMDYVRPTSLRLALYLAVIITLAVSVVWLAAILYNSAMWNVA